MNKVAVTVRAHDQSGGRGRIVRALFYLYMNQIKLGVGTPVFVLLTFVPYNSDEEEDGSSNEEVITGGTWILEPEKGICWGMHCRRLGLRYRITMRHRGEGSSSLRGSRLS